MTNSKHSNAQKLIEIKALAFDTKKTLRGSLQFDQWAHRQLLAESNFISVKIQQYGIARATGKKTGKGKCQQDYWKVSVKLEKKKDNSTEIVLSSYLFMLYPLLHGFISDKKRQNSLKMSWFSQLVKGGKITQQLHFL